MFNTSVCFKYAINFFLYSYSTSPDMIKYFYLSKREHRLLNMVFNLWKENPDLYRRTGFRWDSKMKNYEVEEITPIKNVLKKYYNHVRRCYALTLL